MKDILSIQPYFLAFPLDGEGGWSVFEKNVEVGGGDPQILNSTKMSSLETPLSIQAFLSKRMAHFPPQGGRLSGVF